MAGSRVRERSQGCSPSMRCLPSGMAAAATSWSRRGHGFVASHGANVKRGPGLMRRIRTDSRRRGTAFATGVAVAAIAVLSLVGGLTSTVPPGPTSMQSAVAAATSVVGPVVYTEVLDADGSALIERRLDGHSLPRRVAVRTEVDYGRTWSVDPRGTMAVALVPGRVSQRLEAISIADGTNLWELEIPNAQLDEAVWSADGR